MKTLVNKIPTHIDLMSNCEHKTVEIEFDRDGFNLFCIQCNEDVTIDHKDYELIGHKKIKETKSKYSPYYSSPYYCLQVGKAICP